jgi:hypothetical protein
MTATVEKWLDKKELAEHLSCSVRSIQTALAEGCPHVRIFGRVKFHASEVEVWLEQHGYLERPGDGTIVSNNGMADQRGERRPAVVNKEDESYVHQQEA